MSKKNKTNNTTPSNSQYKYLDQSKIPLESISKQQFSVIQAQDKFQKDFDALSLEDKKKIKEANLYFQQLETIEEELDKYKENVERAKDNLKTVNKSIKERKFWKTYEGVIEAKNNIQDAKNKLKDLQKKSDEIKKKSKNSIQQIEKTAKKLGKGLVFTLDKGTKGASLILGIGDTVANLPIIGDLIEDIPFGKTAKTALHVLAKVVPGVRKGILNYAKKKSNQKKSKLNKEQLGEKREQIKQNTISSFKEIAHPNTRNLKKPILDLENSREKLFKSHEALQKAEKQGDKDKILEANKAFRQSYATFKKSKNHFNQLNLNEGLLKQNLQNSKLLRSKSDKNSINEKKLLNANDKGKLQYNELLQAQRIARTAHIDTHSKSHDELIGKNDADNKKIKNFLDTDSKKTYLASSLDLEVSPRQLQKASKTLQEFNKNTQISSDNPNQELKPSNKIVKASQEVKDITKEILSTPSMQDLKNESKIHSDDNKKDKDLSKVQNILKNAESITNSLPGALDNTSNILNKAKKIFRSKEETPVQAYTKYTLNNEPTDIEKFLNKVSSYTDEKKESIILKNLSGFSKAPDIESLNKIMNVSPSAVEKFIENPLNPSQSNLKVRVLDSNPISKETYIEKDFIDYVKQHHKEHITDKVKHIRNAIKDSNDLTKYGSIEPIFPVNNQPKLNPSLVRRQDVSLDGFNKEIKGTLDLATPEERKLIVLKLLSKIKKQRNIPRREILNNIMDASPTAVDEYLKTDRAKQLDKLYLRTVPTDIPQNTSTKINFSNQNLLEYIKNYHENKLDRNIEKINTAIENNNVKLIDNILKNSSKEDKESLVLDIIKNITTKEKTPNVETLSILIKSSPEAVEKYLNNVDNEIKESHKAQKKLDIEYFITTTGKTENGQISHGRKPYKTNLLDFIKNYHEEHNKDNKFVENIKNENIAQDIEAEIINFGNKYKDQKISDKSVGVLLGNIVDKIEGRPTSYDIAVTGIKEEKTIEGKNLENKVTASLRGREHQSQVEAIASMLNLKIKDISFKDKTQFSIGKFLIKSKITKKIGEELVNAIDLKKQENMQIIQDTLIKKFRDIVLPKQGFNETKQIQNRRNILVKSIPERLKEKNEQNKKKQI